MPCALATETQSRSAHGRLELAERDIQVFVDYNKIELGHVPHLAQRAGHAARDDIFAVRPARTQATLEFLQRGRQDEYADGLGKLPPHLLRLLTVRLRVRITGQKWYNVLSMV